MELKIISNIPVSTQENNISDNEAQLHDELVSGNFITSSHHNTGRFR